MRLQLAQAARKINSYETYFFRQVIPEKYYFGRNRGGSEIQDQTKPDIQWFTPDPMSGGERPNVVKREVFPLTDMGEVLEVYYDNRPSVGRREGVPSRTWERRGRAGQSFLM